MYKYCLDTLNSQINQILALDESVQESLKDCPTCTIQLSIKPLEKPIFIVIKKGKVQLSNRKPKHTIDIDISGSVAAMIELIQNDFSFRHVNEPIEINGDLKQLTQIKHIIDSSVLDLESILAHYTSSWFAQWAVDSSSTLHHHLRQWCEERVQAYYHYAMYEEPIILGPEQFETLTNQLGKLRKRIDELESLIN
ncbi:MAG: hypothetical protein CMF46_02130 [Legionellales bacterium]|nr:hypothetical protein [Legionellales bacterium]|tara:strand:+ start:53 stop:637 length:585 start_codon:yes stop_codon:yes gene_type:complete